MDLDVMGKHVTGLLAFRQKIEDMIAGASEAKSDAGDTVAELISFKASFEKALPELEKAIADVAVVVDDLGNLKSDLAPVLAWVAEQQKAAAEAKEKAEADEKLKAETTAKHEADTAGKAATEKPSVADPVAEHTDFPAESENAAS